MHKNTVTKTKTTTMAKTMIFMLQCCLCTSRSWPTSMEVLVKSQNYEYSRGKMCRDIPAKYLIVWVVGNSLHVAHRVRGLANRPSACYPSTPPPHPPSPRSFHNSFQHCPLHITHCSSNILLQLMLHCLYLKDHRLPLPKYLMPYLLLLLLWELGHMTIWER